jgi:hypothetical protein
MQKGSLIRSSRRLGPEVWEYRWRESCSEQTRKHRRVVIGTLNTFKDESAALHRDNGLHAFHAYTDAVHGVSYEIRGIGRCGF